MISKVVNVQQNGTLRLTGRGVAFLIVPLFPKGSANNSCSVSVDGAPTSIVIPFGKRFPLAFNRSLDLSMQGWQGQQFLYIIANTEAEALLIPGDFQWDGNPQPTGAQNPATVGTVTAPGANATIATATLSINGALNASRGLDIDIDVSAGGDAVNLAIVYTSGLGGQYSWTYNMWMGNGPQKLRLRRYQVAGDTIAVKTIGAGGAGVVYSAMIQIREPGQGE